MISASPPLIGGQFSTVVPPPPYTLLAMTLPLRFPSNPSNLSEKTSHPYPIPPPQRDKY